MCNVLSRYLPLLLAVLLLAPLSAQAKPTPPANLMKVFVLFLDGEELIDEDDWSGIDKWLGELDKQYLALRPEMSKSLSADELAKFEKELAVFRSSSSGKAHKKVYSQFLSLHKAFLQLLDDFDYKSPPLMYLVQNDLKEVNAGLKEGEMDEVEDELEEVALFYGQAIPALRARGMKDEQIEEFKAQQVRCKGALTANDRKLLAAEVAKLQQLLAAQQRLLNGN